MNESAKTITFIVVAGVLALAATGSHFMNQPTNSKDFELVGQPFFPEFESATEAKSLEVIAMNPETARLKRFSVENVEGLWNIPSHFGYPAEAAARLATTATSVMGIERESLAGRLAKEHERLGVVDPLDENIEDPEAAGQRLTLKNSDGEVVVDYIIGKELEDEVATRGAEAAFGQPGKEKYYYVRRPDENQTYKVRLDIDLSTKFSDWIDPDLLRVDSNEITRLEIDNYSIEEDRSDPRAQQRELYKQQGDILKLSQPTTGGVWALDGLDAEKEELQASRVTDILGVLDQLKIAGVRPKYKFKDQVLLTADLELNRQPEFEKDPQGFGRAIQRLQAELADKGFNLAGNAEKMELVSQFGEMSFGTNKGVIYKLHIGNAVEGDEEAIEVGGASSDDSSDDEASDDETSGDSKIDAEGTDAEAANESTDEPEKEIDNRYLLVRVALDPALITPQPIEPKEPVVPVKPEGYVAKPVEKKEVEKPDDVKAPEDVEAPAGVEEPPKEERNPEFVEYDELMKAYEERKVRHGVDLTQWEDEKKAFDKKVEEGQEIVDELNERFGDWYYVMTGDNLKTLRTERADLVTKKELPPGTEPAEPARPDITFPDLPNFDGGMKPEAPSKEIGTPDEDANAKPEKEADANAKPEEADAGKSEPAGQAEEADPKGETTLEASGETESKGEVKTEPKGKSETEPKGKVETEPKGKVETEPKGKVETEPKGKVETEESGKSEKSLSN